MDELLEEYGGMTLAVTGCLAILGVLGSLLFSSQGLLAQLVLLWLG